MRLMALLSRSSVCLGSVVVESGGRPGHLQGSSISHSHESTHIQNLQRSISTHEVAMVSLKKEFQRQSEELLTSQSEARRLRDSLDKKVRAIICRL